MRFGARAAIGAFGYRMALVLLRAWWVVRRPRSSGVRCVLRLGDAVLLVRHTYGDDRWMLPGGRMRRGEPPAAAAEREMRDELGVACSGWRHLGCVPARRRYRRGSRDDEFRRHTTHYVEATVSAPDVRPRRVELRDTGWFDPGTLPEDRADAVDAARAAAWL
ncbi:MAG: NUDIX hydrolase [Actinomycetota bacterium]|nr:NUDIX hydrolase [Actinomycetota bacterium]